MVTAARTLILTAVLLSAADARAQPRAETPYRPAPKDARRLPELSDAVLSRLLLDHQRVLERCARDGRTRAYLVELQARVQPGTPPSTMYNARIHVRTRSRPRDGAFEACVQRIVPDALRHTSYAVGPRGARARHTFHLAEPPEPTPRRPPPPFSVSEVHRAIDARTPALMRCLERGGVLDPITLRIDVRSDGQLILTRADLPPDSSPHAPGCMARQVSALRVEGRPARRLSVVHRLGAR